jgi:hypothetical protein
MQISAFSARVLRQIYRLQRNDLRPSLEIVAVALQQALPEVDRALRELTASGLLERDTLRLTFHGLALAAATSPGAASRPEPQPSRSLGPQLCLLPVVKAFPRRAYPTRRRAALPPARPSSSGTRPRPPTHPEDMRDS